MADSNLDTIYNAIAGWGLAVAGGDVSCRKPEDLKKSLNSSDLPVRLMLPLDNNLEGQEMQVMTLGKPETGGEITVQRWSVMDLMLWQKVGKGSGIEQAADRLVDYCSAYTKAVRYGRKVAENIRIVNMNVLPGQFEWPAGVKDAPLYFGVLATLELTEIVS